MQIFSLPGKKGPSALAGAREQGVPLPGMLELQVSDGKAWEE